MKGLALFAVLAVAKLLAVASRHFPLSPWTPLALFWQDALVALIFGAVDFALKSKPRICWGLYWLMAAYAAFNVPVSRILSSPLTLQMSQATGSALADSITHYFTFSTLAQMAAVLLAAAGFAAGARHFRLRAQDKTPRMLSGFGALAGIALLGALASRHVDCSGFHRNALVAFVDSAFPQIQSVTASTPSTNWRASVAGAKDDENLAWLHGVAAGRNVVLISLESTGARYLRFYGATEDPTPNLTRLAQSSLVFENAYAASPESIMGLFSILCSRYPAFDTRGEDYASTHTPAIAEILSRAGYQTALFHSGRFMYLGMEAVVQQRGFDALQDAGAIGGNFNSSFGVDEPATVARMLQWIDALPRGNRFFLHYLPIAGHHPYATPKPGPFPDSSEANQYRNALHYGDAALGTFLEGLRSRGLDTNTLFVIYGDHGEAFGQHDGNFGHTLFIYEENVKVPLVIAMPGGPARPMRLNRIASLVDVTPTILDLLGLRSAPDYQGTSLLEPGERAALFFTGYSLPLAGVRDGKWKMITELDSSKPKLFDLESDPGETRNLADQHPELVATWQQRLGAWAAAQKGLVLAGR